MRSITVIVLALALSACSVLDGLQFNAAPRLDPNKVYLNRADLVHVGPRETHRFACVNPPLLCEQHGVGFECRCP